MNNNNKLKKLGSFVRLKFPNYLLGSIEETLEYKGKAMMFFLGSPQTYKVVDQKNLDRKLFYHYLKINYLDLENVVVHLPYVINLGNIFNVKVMKNSELFLEKNLALCSFLGIKQVVLHPGSSLKMNPKLCLDRIINILDKMLIKFPNVNICLELMSGKGSELGSKFEELAYIINNAKQKKQINVCFDLCHAYSGGYDIVNDLENVLKHFDNLIGLEKIKVIHVNDSKTFLKSHKDLHANIGFGTIGKEAIKKFLFHDQIKDKIMILETPYRNGVPLYKEEIEMLNE